MIIYLIHEEALAIDLGRRSHGCLYVHRLDTGMACWIPRGLIRFQLDANQMDTMALDGQIPLGRHFDPPRVASPAVAP